MIVKLPVMDEKLFERCRSLLEHNDGFAQNADALLRQVEKTLARESVCTFVTPADSDIHKVLFPLSYERKWALSPLDLCLTMEGSATTIPYRLITVRRPKKPVLVAQQSAKVNVAVRN